MATAGRAVQVGGRTAPALVAELAGAAALSPLLDSYKVGMNIVYQRRRDLVCDALAKIGGEAKIHEFVRFSLGFRLDPSPINSDSSLSLTKTRDQFT